MNQTATDLAIELEDLTVAYRDKPVLWDLDLRIPPGVMMAIVGPNGAGKTTLIKSLIGLIKPAAGFVRLFGKPYEEVRHRIGYVPQRTSVDWDFPTTVLDLVMMGMYGKLGWVRRPGKAEKEQAYSALQQVGMQAYADRQISQLSGGQQQRIFLARALVQQAEMYFLDEPLQGVDMMTEKAIIKILHQLREEGKTVVVVHHDLQTVQEYYDWITMINVRLIASGKVQDVFNEENLKSAYGGRISFLGTSTHEKGELSPTS